MIGAKNVEEWMQDPTVASTRMGKDLDYGKYKPKAIENETEIAQAVSSTLKERAQADPSKVKKMGY
jgi:hypothetical protein